MSDAENRGLQICVRSLLHGSQHLIDALPSWQVSELKEAIAERTGIVDVQQHLTLDTQPLEDTKRLSDYDLMNACEVDLNVETKIPVHVAIFVHPCCCNEGDCDYDIDLVLLTVHVDATIADIKLQVHDRASVMSYKIFFQGRVLNNATTLKDCGVQSNDVLCIEGISGQFDYFPSSTPGLLTVVAYKGFNRHDVPAQETDTVSAFKAKLQETAELSACRDHWEMKFPTDGQHLFHRGEELLDDCTLAHYRIAIGTSVLYLHLDYEVVQTCLAYDGVSSAPFPLARF